MERDDALNVHNLPFLEALYEAYRQDPGSVPAEWVPLIDGDGSTHVTAYSSSPPPPDADANTEQIYLQARVDDLIEAYRIHGHLGADVDPLGRDRRTRAPMLEPTNFGLTDGHLDRTFHSHGLLPGQATLREILQRLRNTYCRRVGVEYWSLPSSEEREWLRQRMEATQNEVTPTAAEQHRLLEILANVDSVDNFLHSKFLGAKRFSVSGAETLIPMLDCLIEQAADAGLGEVIFGMAHRGRLNVLMNVLGKDPADVFAEFEKGTMDPRELLGAGDVKYHLGFHRHHVTSTGKNIYLALGFNPSHLEAITPVIQGRVRAQQDSAPPDRHFDASLGVTIHGDAAFAGQGVVAETLNMSQLDGYTTGGLIRVIVNNQIGFTTNPSEARSGMYATDIGKIGQVPIFHVNGDDPEAAAYVVRLAVDFRQRFRRDVIIDLICYRRFGHNEGDDPTFTQPEMYSLIKEHRPVLKIYRDRLVERGTVTKDEVKALEKQFHDSFSEDLERVRNKNAKPQPLSPMHGKWLDYAGGPDSAEHDVDTAVPREELENFTPFITKAPEGFSVHRKIARILGDLDKMYRGDADLNWAAAELAAYASLLLAGHPVRISGQDSMRGTFSHRHSVLNDSKTGERYAPLAHLSEHVSGEQARFDVFNSPLSEFSVLGFEFGYSLWAPQSLVIWEAQFGDFANGAQVIIDQFLSSSEDKWNRISGLVMMLPHGYEGQGPEHSSARLERFLQMCAEDNMQVVNLTTPAQVFHVLRRQVLRKWRKPLVMMTPKSLLRYRPSFSPIDDLCHKSFQRTIGDNSVQKGDVTRVIMSAGKVYYDLLGKREELGLENVALVRVEQLYPFPAAELESTLRRFSGAKELFWVQEEPRNMGPWEFVRERLEALTTDRDGGPLRPTYCGREASASPATGSPEAHQLELQMILEAAFKGL